MGNDLTYTLKLANAAFQGPLKQSEQSLQSFRGHAAGASQAVGGMGSAFGSVAGKIGGLVAGLASVAAVMGALKSAVSGAANMETLEVSFTNLIGSAGQAKSTLAGLAQFAASTPFELPDVATAGKTLLSAGISADKLQGALGSLGNVTSAFGGDIKTVSTIFSQVVNKGQLYAEEIQQMGENGVPALALLSEAMGKSKAEVIAMASAGELTASDLARAFDKAGGAGGKFANAMTQQSQTTAGLWSSVSDAIGEVARAIGTPINEHFLKPLMRDALNLAPSLTGGIQAAVTLLKAAFNQGGLSGVGDIIGLSLRVAFAQATVSLFNGMVKAGTMAATFIGEAVSKAMHGDMSGLKQMADAANPMKLLQDAFHLDDLKKELSTALKGLDSGAFEQLSNALQGKTKGATAAGVAGGLSDAVGAAGGDAAGAGQGGAGGGKAKGAIEKVSRKIHGYTQAQNPVAGGLAEYAKLQERDKIRTDGVTLDGKRAFAAFGNGTARPGPMTAAQAAFAGISGAVKDVKASVLDGREKGGSLRDTFKFGALDAMKDLGKKTLDTPGKATKREREQAAATQQGKEQKQRWDLVANIEASLKNIAVA